MKLPLHEKEREALRSELGRWEGVVSSALLRIEAERACARYGEGYATRARAGLDAVALVPIDERVVESAARLRPSSLRTLDAIHLATALSLGDDLGALIAYDERLAAAAGDHGVRVLAPGASVP